METTIKPSEIFALHGQGYTRVCTGDAAKANSDYFMMFERDNDDGTKSIRILCPSFLRGSLGFAKVKGGISY